MRAALLVFTLIMLVPFTRADDGTGEVHELAFVRAVDDGFVLALISADGENQQDIYTCADICRDPIWSADGGRIGLVDGQTLVVIAADTGDVEARVAVDMGTYDYTARPDWTDDLSHVVYAARVDMVNVLRVVTIADGDVNTIDHQSGGAPAWPRWTPDGHILYAGGGMVYITGDEADTPLTITDSIYDWPVLSPDGMHFAARQLDEPGGLIILGDMPQLAYMGVIDSPVWSPDSRQIALNSWNDGVVTLVVISLEETAEPLIIADDAVLNYGPAWSPDGGTLAYYGANADQPQFLNLFTVAADGDGVPQALVAEVRRVGGIPDRPAWRPYTEEPDDL